VSLCASHFLLLEFDGSLLYARRTEVFETGLLVFKSERYEVKQFVLTSLLVLVATGTALSQGKGVDKQSERVRDGGSSTPASNGSKQNTGSGRGFDFGKGKTPRIAKLDNPYRLAGRRDVILKAVQDMMRDRKLIVDDAASRPADGIIVSQPYRFIKGAVVTQAELGRYADVPSSAVSGWTQGRYTIMVEVQQIDGFNSKVSVNAKIEGRSDGPSGAEWVTLPSLGTAEDEFLAALIEAVTGTSAPGRAPANP
jgi:hypothetical protein